MQPLSHIDKLFNRLFAHIEQLEKKRDFIEAFHLNNGRSPPELARFHLATCRSLLKKCRNAAGRPETAPRAMEVLKLGCGGEG